MLTTRSALFAATALFLASCAVPSQRTQASRDAAEAPRDTRRWYPAHELHVEGQGFDDPAHRFGRLPASARVSLRDVVWKLGRCSAGLSVRFRTDAQELHVRWKLGGGQLALPHMPATGVSGADLYVQELGALRWLATAVPFAQQNEIRLFSGLDGTMREFVLYLPLYNSVESLELGVPAGESLAPWPRAASARPLVFYGTSITQGACASRPGACHVAMLGRRLDRPVVNLGFSGNGKLEPAFVPLLASIDAEVYVLDCLPNMHGELVRERLVPFVRALRAARPETPILLVEDRRYADAYLNARRRARNEDNWRAQREGFERLRAEGCKALHYLRGVEQLGEDSDDTVDGSHPSDLGFYRMAEAFERALLPLLSRRSD